MIEINQDFADGVLHSRNPETNKNDYGRILCVCGSAGYTGAAYFSAQGAVRMGSGIVTLATPEGAWPVLAVKLNEPVVRPMPQEENGLFSMDALSKLLALAEKADALLIGCGLGRSDTLTEIVCTLLEKAACQIVLDADGINSITGHKDILRRTAKPVVLTPHADCCGCGTVRAGLSVHRALQGTPHPYFHAGRRGVPQYLGQSRHGERRQRGCSGRHAGFAVRTGH